MRSAYLPWLAWWLLLLLPACKPEVHDVPATRVVARIDADAEVRARLSALRVRVAGERNGEWAQRSDARFAASNLKWPVDVVIAPQRESDAGSYFEVVVEALGDDDDVLVQARALTAVVLRETRILTLQLERCGTSPLGFVCESEDDCYGPNCRTCVNARCDKTPIVEPQGLAPFTPPIPNDGVPLPNGSSAGGSEDEGAAGEPQGPSRDAQVTPDTSTGDAGPGACGDGYEPNGEGGCIDIDECARDLDDCDDAPDACVNLEGAGFRCRCPSGYEGDGVGPDGCTDLDDCSPNPCLNGGTCTDGVNSFTCKCPSGFTGDRCELEICGPLSIRTKSDIDANKNCAEVRGNLTLMGGATELNAEDFPHLRKVTGDVLVTAIGAQLPLFERITLKALQTIEGALRIEGSGALVAMELPELATIGRSTSPARLRVLQAPLYRLDLPQLTHVHGDVDILIFQLCALNVRKLTSVSGNVSIRGTLNVPYSAVRPFIQAAAGTVEAERVGCCTLVDAHGCDELYAEAADEWSEFCTDTCL